MMEKNVIQINGVITINVDVNVKSVRYVKKDYIWNHSILLHVVVELENSEQVL